MEMQLHAIAMPFFVVEDGDDDEEDGRSSGV
jgi:hypothetical protein